MLGASYAVKTEGRYLQECEAGRLVVTPVAALSYLVETWDEFEKLGFGPPQNGPYQQGALDQLWGVESETEVGSWT